MKVSSFRGYFFTVLLLVFFLFPYVSFLRFFNWQVAITSSELIWVLKNSFLQSVVAAVICVTLGFYFSLGLFQLPEKIISVVSKIVLLPQMLPTLFSILIAFSILNPFPMGHLGVIFIFVLINLGFSVYQISLAIQNKLGQLALVSEVFGISKNQFRSRVLIPLVWADLKLNFLFTFLFCFSSLSVPLVAGGGKGTNLEVLIFEKIFIEQSWDSAWLLMVLQMTVVFLISYFFLRSRSYTAQAFKQHFFYKSKPAAIGLLTYVAGYVGIYLLSVGSSLGGLDDILLYQDDVITATRNSLLLVLGLLCVSFIVLIVWIFDYVNTLRHSIAMHFISVSTVLVGFSFYIFFPLSSRSDFLKMPLAFGILFFPVVFKIFFEKQIDQLRHQIVAAKVFSISPGVIVFQVILRQVLRPLFFAASFLMIWTLSDFAISRAVGTQSQTLGLISESFLTGYRLDAAFLISFYILILWLFLTAMLHFVFKGIYGAYK